MLRTETVSNVRAIKIRLDWKILKIEHLILLQKIGSLIIILFLF